MYDTVHERLNTHSNSLRSYNPREDPQEQRLDEATQKFETLKNIIRASPYVFGNPDISYRMHGIEAQLAEKRKLHEKANHQS